MDERRIYKVEVVTGKGEVWAEGTCKTNDELFAFIGKIAVWGFLSLDVIDHEDAPWYADGDLLAFTCNKPNRLRHGLHTNVFAIGHIWENGKKTEAKIIIKRAE